MPLPKYPAMPLNGPLRGAHGRFHHLCARSGASFERIASKAAQSRPQKCTIRRRISKRKLMDELSMVSLELEMSMQSLWASLIFALDEDGRVRISRDIAQRIGERADAVNGISSILAALEK
jgi:hypothetical protein